MEREESFLEEDFKEIMDVAKRILREVRYDIETLERIADISLLFKTFQDHEGYLEPLYTVSAIESGYRFIIDVPCADKDTIEVSSAKKTIEVRVKISGDKIRALSTMGASTPPIKGYRLKYDLPFEPDPNKIRVRMRAGFIELIVMK